MMKALIFMAGLGDSSAAFDGDDGAAATTLFAILVPGRRGNSTLGYRFCEPFLGVDMQPLFPRHVSDKRQFDIALQWWNWWQNHVILIMI